MAGRVVSSKTVMEGRLFNVRVDRIMVGGREVVKEVVVHPGAVAVVPILDTGEIVLVKQYRHAVAETLWEVPAGTLEPGESPERCAERELEEETGFRPGQLSKICQYYLAPSYSTEIIHLFVASDLIMVGQKRQEDEEIDVASYSLEDALEMVRKRVIRDSKTIAALYMYKELYHNRERG
jgi:ADP-ribose pyrophosphatase